MIIIGLVLFMVGAIVAAVANNFATLLVGRSLQGVGGGGLLVLTEIVVTDLVPLRMRGQWFGIISAMWSIGSVTGPIIGGAFAQNVTWVYFCCLRKRLHNNTDDMQRWIFWINLPFIGIAFVFVPLFLRLSFKPSPWIVQLKRVDWIGSFIFIASSTSFLIPITWVCHEHI